jgi:excisionase family DNA binding protein
MTNKSPSSPRLFNVDDIATALAVSTKTVRRLIERRELPSLRIGTLVRVSEDDLQVFLKLHRA